MTKRAFANEVSDGESGYITDNTDKPLEVPLFGAFGCLT
jgi:hypothetical protein